MQPLIPGVWSKVLNNSIHAYTCIRTCRQKHSREARRTSVTTLPYTQHYTTPIHTTSTSSLLKRCSIQQHNHRHNCGNKTKSTPTIQHVVVVNRSFLSILINVYLSPSPQLTSVSSYLRQLTRSLYRRMGINRHPTQVLPSQTSTHGGTQKHTCIMHASTRVTTYFATHHLHVATHQSRRPKLGNSRLCRLVALS